MLSAREWFGIISDNSCDTGQGQADLTDAKMQNSTVLLNLHLNLHYITPKASLNMIGPCV